MTDTTAAEQQAFAAATDATAACEAARQEAAAAAEAVTALEEETPDEEREPVEAESLAKETALAAAERTAASAVIDAEKAAREAKAADPVGDPLAWVGRWLKRNNPMQPQPYWPVQDTVDQILAVKESNPDNIMAKCFDPEFYGSLNEEMRARLLQCLNSGRENPDSAMGCYACQPADYDDLKPFFKKALAVYHGVEEDATHVNSWDLSEVEGLPEDGQLDLTVSTAAACSQPTNHLHTTTAIGATHRLQSLTELPMLPRAQALGLPELSMRVRVGRNLSNFPLPGAMSRQDRCDMEMVMMQAFETLIEMPEYGGKYISITPEHDAEVSAEEYDALVQAHIMFKDMSADTYLTSAGIAGDWPYGRGCYISEDKGFIIWVGEEDHLRIMCMKHGAILNEVFDRLKAAGADRPQLPLIHCPDKRAGTSPVNARRLWKGRSIFSRATENGPAFCGCFVCTQRSAGPLAPIGRTHSVPTTAPTDSYNLPAAQSMSSLQSKAWTSQCHLTSGL